MEDKDIESGSQVTINSKLNSWIQRISQDSEAPSDLRSRCCSIIESTPKCIPVSFIQKVAQYASQRRERGKTPKTTTAYNNDFLEGAKWYFAEGVQPPKRDFANETAVERIRNDAAAREYARMTKTIHQNAKGTGISGFAADLRVAQTETLAVVNCLITVIGSGVFAYFATGLAVGDHLIAQVLVAILVSCVVAIADIYFLMKKLHKSETTDDTAARNVSAKFDLNRTSYPEGKVKSE
ncbi:uncharacterized protein LOC129594391 [Paramacrobiotus metropolitanus]|uniref:uncharacterized protein LOC129594391 n=1 Tax=Paramacrobiotus metropolitanus TaxID=2943436 RepID=UPI002445B48C|nr:uncharacterized protein LOC129594391 [Paramacrobiotus metropolitanus]